MRIPFFLAAAICAGSPAMAFDHQNACALTALERLPKVQGLQIKDVGLAETHARPIALDFGWRVTIRTQVANLAPTFRFECRSFEGKIVLKEAD